MRIGILKESRDNRVALTPDVVKILENEKNEVCVEKGAGESSYIEDWKYNEVGARLETHDGAAGLAIFPSQYSLEKNSLVLMHPSVVRSPDRNRAAHKPVRPSLRQRTSNQKRPG